MALKTSPDKPLTAGMEPLVLDAGNMGLRHFANMRAETGTFLTIDGDAAAADQSRASILASAFPSNAVIGVSLTHLPFLEIKDVAIVSQVQVQAMQPRPFKIAFMARWARAQAEIFVPPMSKPCYFILLARTPKLSARTPMHLTINMGTNTYAGLTPVPDCWQWHVIPLPASASGKWLTITSEPAWNPEKPGFPSDLGILVGHIAFWPASTK